MSETLVQKALKLNSAAPPRKTSLIRERAELAIAFYSEQVSCKAICAALECKATSVNAKMSGFLATAIRRGVVTVTINPEA